MSINVNVDLDRRSYNILIGQGLLQALGSETEKLMPAGQSCLVLTDSNVGPLYAAQVIDALSTAGFKTFLQTIPAGEGAKSFECASALCSHVADIRLDRRSFLVALGGGVVGDLAGFVSGIFMRGIPFIQVPTSLLAMVDSSVGGKTGINLAQGKNLVGVFHQPRLVLADTNTLKTLPKREYVSGLAEVVKYGVICDKEFFSLLEKNADALCAADPELLERVIGRCCEIKASIVREDEREGGLRAILNFGHTMGHAIEKAGGYSRFLHGEAVALGMVYAALLSARVKGLAAADCERIVNLIDRLGLPVKKPPCDWGELRGAMGLDKKGEGGVPRFVLAERIGEVSFRCEVPAAMLEKVWKSMA